MAETNEINESTKTPAKKVVSRTVCILLIFIAAILAGLGGYAYGSSMATSEAEKELEQQVQSLEKDLNTAKAAAGSELQEGQEAVTEGQATLETVQAENASLKSTIETQEQQIADLEQQLEDAQADDSSTDTPQ